MRAGAGRALVILLAAVPACAGRHVSQGAMPVKARSAGATDWFGPGATAIRGELRNEIRVELTRPASVVVLHLIDNELVRLVRVVRLDSGQHWVEVPPQLLVDAARGSSPTPDARLPSEGIRRMDGVCEARRSAASTRRLVSDSVPVAGSCAMMTRVAQLSATANGSRADQNRGASRSGRVPDYIMLVTSDSAVTVGQVAQRLAAVVEFDFATVTHDLPEFLVGRRTPMWAGYLVSR